MNRTAIALSVTAASLALTAAVAPAATLALTNFNNTGFPADTRASGSATNSAFSIDGTHSSVLLTSTNTVDGDEKVAPFFYGTVAYTQIGTLGDLARGGLTADWRLESRGASVPSFVGNIAAFRLFVGRPDVSPTATAEIIWEAGYQSTVPTFNAGQNYDNVDIGSGKFYVRTGGQNYGDGNNGGVNALTLAQLANGEALTSSANNPVFSDSTPVYGLTVSVGSAAGDYTAYVGDLNATFTAVPEPASVAVLGLGAATALRRRRTAR